MFLFITGKQNSGKSEYAEKCACELNINRFYLATMQVMDDDGIKRVKRHRELRSGKGFITIECPKDIDKLEFEQDSVVLLECISNLVGNEMFAGIKPEDISHTVDKVMTEVMALVNKVDDVVVVSSIYDDSEVTLDAQTSSYMEALRIVNDKLTKLADKAVVISTKH